jgi:hypothetical protein
MWAEPLEGNCGEGAAQARDDSSQIIQQQPWARGPMGRAFTNEAVVPNPEK